MMKFIKIFAVILVVSFAFVFFGGWMLFDFSERFYVATAACALVVAAIVSLFVAQSDRIERLEKRVKELEDKSKSDV